MRVRDGVERGPSMPSMRCARPRGTATPRSAAVRSPPACCIQCREGHPGRGDGARRARADRWPRGRSTGPTTVHGHQLVWSGELDPRGRSSTRSTTRPGAERVGGRRSPSGTWPSGMAGGELGRVRGLTAASLELRTQLGRVMPTDEMPAVDHHGVPGSDRRCARHGGAREGGGRGEGDPIVVSFSSGSSASSSSLSGDAASALPHLRRANERFGRLRARAGQRVDLGDLLEALVAAGELDEADAILAREEPRASVLERASALAIFARCRALVLGGARRPRGSVRELRAGARRACPHRRPVPARPDAARARPHPAPREEARRGPPDARGRAGSLRSARRPALGRADARRAGAHRRPCSVARRPDRSRAPHRSARRRGPDEQ